MCFLESELTWTSEKLDERKSKKKREVRGSVGDTVD